MAALSEALDKIRSIELREAALAGEGIVRTVLVEVDLPRPQVVASGRSPLTPGQPSFRVIGDRGSEAQVTQVRRAIETALGHPVERYLPSSRAFVVKATGREIQRVAELPAVLALWPNTRRPLVQAG
ncbi:hypothetical protein [Rubellimicrobium arenae]|uniref:hypothetical protein n=1 Tax=Rubellimicrobium arenae TaxID=2817372 RepID=UPI001B30BED5|nr:hypothetical protein [Rubellimicrobium arenae]